MMMAAILSINYVLGLCSALIRARWPSRVVLAIAVLWPLLVVGVMDAGNGCLSATIYREDCIFISTLLFSPIFLGSCLLAISLGVLTKRLVKSVRD